MKNHKRQEDLWLTEMMEAALEDSPDIPGEHEIDSIIRKASSEKSSGKQFRPRRSWLLPAAAALLAASITLPIGIITGRRITEKNTGRSVDDAFVEELIGGTLFDEGLMESQEWFSDINFDENYFDI